MSEVSNICTQRYVKEFIFNFWYINFCSFKFLFECKKERIKTYAICVFYVDFGIFLDKVYFMKILTLICTNCHYSHLYIELKVSILDIGYKIVYKFNTGFNLFLKINKILMPLVPSHRNIYAYSVHFYIFTFLTNA